MSVSTCELHTITEEFFVRILVLSLMTEVGRYKNNNCISSAYCVKLKRKRSIHRRTMLIDEHASFHEVDVNIC